MYKFLVRPLLFLIHPEAVHHLVFNFLKVAGKVPGFGWLMRQFCAIESPLLEKELMGLKFNNPVGLAAGFDKDARLVNEWGNFGFGFVEIGTITPRPQPGNDKPRLFRLPQDNALINRMGFNNEGVEAATRRLKSRTSGVIVGANIGKNKLTPNESAVDDYVACFEALYPVADYFVLNVSSPNTPGLRELQEREPLRILLSTIKKLSLSKPSPKPVLLKISPDLTTPQLDDIVEILKSTSTDGVIATNTTIGREGLKTNPDHVKELGAGGLSGRPLQSRSNEVIAYLRQRLGKDYPIIGVGGILSAQDAVDKIHAGADLVQVYTGFVYEGPGFARQICKALINASKSDSR